MHESRRVSFSVAAGLFLVSAAMLALQVLQTRILAVTMWHHCSTMVVTMTMLGFAAAGAFVTVRRGLLAPPVAPQLAWCGSLFAVATLGAYVLLARTADRAAVMTAAGDYVELSLFYSYLFVPYFFGGLVVTIALATAANVHRLYFVDLVGSAAGAWLFFAAVEPLGAERLVVACAAAGPLAALVFSAAPERGASRRARLAGIGAALAALAGCAALLADPAPLAVLVASNKAEAHVLRREPGAEVVARRWSPLCRLDVVRVPASDGAAEVLHVYQDGDAATIVHSDAGWGSRPALDIKTLAYVPHVLGAPADGPAPPLRVLSLGVGGGSDLRYALDHGATSVLGIELNPAMVDLVGRELAPFHGDLYRRPGVEVRVGEGRAALRRMDERFDVLQISGTDTYTAANAGAHVLSESYLYTAEAFAEYFAHLEQGGTLGLVRLAFDPPRENLRLLALGLEALRRRGVERPSRHAAIVVQEARDPLTGESLRRAGSVFSLDPLPADVVALLRRADEVPGHRVAYAPGLAEDNAFTRLARAIDERREEAFYDEYPLEVAPVVDDSPFFFRFHGWRALFGGGGAPRYQDLTGGPIGVRLLGAMLAQTVVLSTLLVLVPLVLVRRRGLAVPSAGRHLAFFAALGAGFFLLEISAIQRLVLFLGHPTYSLTVTLVCLLVSAGLGSLFARRFDARPERALRGVAAAQAVAIAAFALGLEPLLDALLHLPLGGRVACAAAVLAPLGFVLGMPFPIGLARLRRLAPPLVPWALGVNGAAGVVASVVAVLVAMESGFRAVALLALGLYVAGALIATSGPLAPRVGTSRPARE